jgi:hypothetical protein
MSEVLISPGVFSQENDLSPITQGPVQVGAALVGPTVIGQVNKPTVVTSYSDYKSIFGASFVSGGSNYEYLTSLAAINYFEQGGDSLIVTRVASGSYTSATASVPSFLSTTASATLNLTNAAAASYVLNLNGTSITLSGSTPQDVYNRATSSINAVTGISASAFSTPNVTFVTTVKGAVANSYFYTSGSTTVNFSGGTDAASFVLETISVGEVMNNSGGTVTNGALPSGSNANVRWEVVSSNSGSGLFSLIVRRGDDYTNNKTILETWTNLSLDPNQSNYISYVIGDQVETAIADENGDYYLQTTGNYPVKSKYVRVKQVNYSTPNYFDSTGQPKSEYFNYLPMVGSGSVNGSFSGAVGALYGCYNQAPLNLFESIPSVSTDIAANNIQGLLRSNYNVAISLLENKDAYRFNVIFAPGLTSQNAPSQIASIVALAQDRGDNIAVIDLVGYAKNVSEVVSEATNYDNSYAAAYWPWLQVRSRETGKLNFIPASTLVPAIYEYNDKVSAEWFAPAGLNRGGMGTVLQPERKLSVNQRNTLYQGKVNPIANFPGVGTVIYGQKTLQSKASALDRVNVRRLLISLKDYIGQIGETLVFEPNTQSTRNKFLNQVNPYLETVQQRQGLYAFQVIMDETNNTPDVIDRNQLIGTIYLQPTRAAEYIYLNFNILPTGASFS